MRLIDADALTAAFAADSVKFKTEEFHVSAVETEIESAPTIDAVPVVHGQWVEFTCFCSVGCEFESRAKCSACRYTLLQHEIRCSVCPHCGAKMDAPNGGGV